MTLESDFSAKDWIHLAASNRLHRLLRKKPKKDSILQKRVSCAFVCICDFTTTNIDIYTYIYTYIEYAWNHVHARITYRLQGVHIHDEPRPVWSIFQVMKIVFQRRWPQCRTIKAMWSSWWGHLPGNLTSDTEQLFGTVWGTQNSLLKASHNNT